MNAYELLDRLGIVDFVVTGRDHWKAMYRRVDESGETAALRNAALALIGKFRGNARKKSWEQVLPADVVAWADMQYATESARNGDPCINNFRCADIRKSSQMRRFHRDEGCCGRHHWTAWYHGREYLMGFNYGH